VAIGFSKKNIVDKETKIIYNQIKEGGL